MGVNIGAFVSPLTVSWLRSALRLERGVHVGGGRDGVVVDRRSSASTEHVAEAAVKVDHAVGPRQRAAADEVRSRVITLLAIFGISLVFWIAFYQIFYTFTFWARDSTARTWPPERYQTFEPLGVILLSPVLVAIWAWLQKRNAEPSTPVKMLIGVVLVAARSALLGYAGTIGGDTGRVSPRGSSPPI